MLESKLPIYVQLCFGRQPPLVQLTLLRPECHWQQIDSDLVRLFSLRFFWRPNEVLNKQEHTDGNEIT